MIPRIAMRPARSRPGDIGLTRLSRCRVRIRSTRPGRRTAGTLEIEGDAMALTLVIGNKNYSSWSLRPWIAMKVAGIAFDETIIPLYEPGSREQVLTVSPTGKVPVLVAADPHTDDLHIWETIAILDFLAEEYPDAMLWPNDRAARAHARAIAAEMHAGFTALRRHLPMNMRRAGKPRQSTPPEVMNDVRRIDDLWSDCRRRFGAGGPFLCGAFGAVDAMYAPVVSRFHSYATPVGDASRDYMAAVMALPAWSQWHAAALVEPWVMAGNEVD
jgi:glutathione S-transferase